VGKYADHEMPPALAGGNMGFIIIIGFSQIIYPWTSQIQVLLFGLKPLQIGDFSWEEWAKATFLLKFGL
jgi:hypothetical protein